MLILNLKYDISLLKILLSYKFKIKIRFLKVRCVICENITIYKFKNAISPLRKIYFSISREI